MRHEHDPRIAASRPQALWHADPNFEAVMRDLLAQTRPDRLIETGTHMGWTADWFARELPTTPLHTVESFPCTEWKHAPAQRRAAPAAAS